MGLIRNVIHWFRYFREYRYAKILQDSGMFDEKYYIEEYEDVAKSRISPALHYVLFGAKEGRNPSSIFNTEAYLRLNPDVMQNGMNPLLHYIRFGMQEGRKIIENVMVIDKKRIDIITTKHTRYLAELYKKYLQEISVESSIIEGEPEVYENIPYIVICPQFLKKLPLFFYAVQMEQTVSSRWLTDEYYNKLNAAQKIIDYSLENIYFLRKCKKIDSISNLYYVPVDYYSNYRAYEKTYEYDVLFYGDMYSCMRRKEIIEKLSREFRVKVCSEVFGDELYREIAKAKVLVNIHYYDNSLLETTRLYETLSLNTTMIVSESSADLQEDEKLTEIVDFVPVDDYEKLRERIAYWISHDEERNQKIAENHRQLSTKPNSFAFYFYRFLLAEKWISFDKFYELSGDYVQLKSTKLCLSLPESVERRKSFDADNNYGFECIPGLRHSSGWIGCGMSYKFIFKKAMETKFKAITICEDDVLFPENFEEKIDKIENYLKNTSKWDVFSGVMADVGNVRVKNWERMGDMEFVEINHMISMVYNIYNSSIFSILANWDEQNEDVMMNTIDRYLERRNLSVWTVLPFLVGHKEELDSTIWGHGNDMYKKMIEKSEKTLQGLTDNYAVIHMLESIQKQLEMLNKEKLN